MNARRRVIYCDRLPGIALRLSGRHCRPLHSSNSKYAANDISRQPLFDARALGTTFCSVTAEISSGTSQSARSGFAESDGVAFDTESSAIDQLASKTTRNFVLGIGHTGNSLGHEPHHPRGTRESQTALGEPLRVIDDHPQIRLARFRRVAVGFTPQRTEPIPPAGAFFVIPLRHKIGAIANDHVTQSNAPDGRTG